MGRFFHCSDYGSQLECSQNRYTMLNLPKKWRQMSAGGTTRYLFRQLQTLRRQTVFQRHLFIAALEIHSSACLRKTGRRLPVQARRGMFWQINDYTFMLCPTINDDALYSCQLLVDRMPWYTIIVPPDTSCVFNRALRELMAARSPTVFSIDLYITWRMTFDSYDLGVDSRETFMDLLGRYNKHISTLRDSSNLTVRLPRNL